MLIVDPDQSYRVSVFNIPKPELEHSSYDVSTKVIVPGEFEVKSSIWLFYLFCIEQMKVCVFVGLFMFLSIVYE